MPRRALRLLIIIAGLLAVLDASSNASTTTQAKQARHHHAKPAKPTHHSVNRKDTRKAVIRKTAVRAPSLAITIRAPNDAPDFDYTDRIQEAQALVAKQPVLPGDMVVDGAGNLSHFTWVLAVGRKTGPLTIVRMDEHGVNDQGLVITWPVDNFINTKFHVAEPDGTIVFAQRRPVRAKNGKGWEEAVYTTYAPELDTRKMRDAGMDYLRHLQRLAYNHIKDNDVRSRVDPDATVADKIPTDMVLRLMITEHVDPLHMKFVGIEQCIHEVLVTVAANQAHAYAYARSSAGALGLPQFMEDSYQMVRVNYPKALLEPNFDLGMSNLRNAVLASVLLLDLELTHLPSATLKVVTDSSVQFAAFLAAGYNRNPAHVARTYRRTRSFTGGDVPFENKMYVRIQSWVGGFLKRQYDIP
ncbi:MAG TPA: hypothetical protein VGM26_01295 [Rhizomicrobium sp.]|jgi:hypothetical protein